MRAAVAAGRFPGGGTEREKECRISLYLVVPLVIALYGAAASKQFSSERIFSLTDPVSVNFSLTRSQGRLGQVCVMSDVVLQPAQVKSLCSSSSSSSSSPAADPLNIFDARSDLESLKDKILFHFHPKYAKDNVCHDLSGTGLVGRLTGKT